MHLIDFFRTWYAAISPVSNIIRCKNWLPFLIRLKLGLGLSVDSWTPRTLYPTRIPPLSYSFTRCFKRLINPPGDKIIHSMRSQRAAAQLALEMILDLIQPFAFRLIRMDSECASPAGTFSFNTSLTATEAQCSRKGPSLVFSSELNPPQLKGSARHTHAAAGRARRHTERHTGRWSRGKAKREV